MYKFCALHQRKTITRYGIAFNYQFGGGKLINVDSVPRIITKVWKKDRPGYGKFFNPQKTLWTITLQPKEVLWIKNVASAGSGYYISSTTDPQNKYFVVPYDEM